MKMRCAAPRRRAEIAGGPPSAWDGPAALAPADRSMSAGRHTRPVAARAASGTALMRAPHRASGLADSAKVTCRPVRPRHCRRGLVPARHQSPGRACRPPARGGRAPAEPAQGSRWAMRTWQGCAVRTGRVVGKGRRPDAWKMSALASAAPPWPAASGRGLPAPGERCAQCPGRCGRIGWPGRRAPGGRDGAAGTPLLQRNLQWRRAPAGAAARVRGAQPA